MLTTVLPTYVESFLSFGDFESLFVYCFYLLLDLDIYNNLGSGTIGTLFEEMLVLGPLILTIIGCLSFILGNLLFSFEC